MRVFWLILVTLAVAWTSCAAWIPPGAGVADGFGFTAAAAARAAASAAVIGGVVILGAQAARASRPRASGANRVEFLMLRLSSSSGPTDAAGGISDRASAPGS